MPDRDRVLGVILAGGRSSRMASHPEFIRDANSSKARMSLAGDPLVDRVCRKFQPQVGRLVITANDDPVRYDHLGLVVLPDRQPGYPGPLAGLASGMAFGAAHCPDYEWVSLAPCDAPFLPDNLVEVLGDALARQGGQVACPRYGGHLQPTFSLWSIESKSLVEKELYQRHRGGLKDLMAQLDCTVVDWPHGHFDPFFNINTPQQLGEAEALISTGSVA